MRQLISAVSITVALVALGLVLYNATLVDRRPPSVVAVTLSAPADDSRVAQTLTAIDIEFSEPVKAATVESRLRIEPFVTGALTWDGTTAIFTPSSRLPPDTDFSVSIDPGVEDLNGNVDAMGMEAWTFRTVGPPTVVRSSPADGVTGLRVDGEVELDFDRLMDTSSVDAAISIEPSVPVVTAWSGETVHLSFGPGLAFGTRYTLTVGSGAADTSGDGLSAPFVLHFTTVAAGLGVVEAIPAAGVSGVGVNSPIVVRFDGPIDPDTARSALRITPSVDGEVRIVAVADDSAAPGSDAAPRGPDTILFVPSSPLAAHTTYTVTLAPTVARAGDPATVAAGLAWAFTTGSPTASGQNQLAFLTARSGARNVWLMNPDGTNQRQLTTEILPVSGFDATADGSRVVYAAAGIVYEIGIDGSGRRQVSPDGVDEYAPVISPDDGWVVVGRRGPEGADLGWWLEPLPGTPGDPRQLVPAGAPPIGSVSLGGDGVGDGGGTPLWTPRAAFDPSGRWLLLVAADGSVSIIDLGDPDGTAAATVADLTGGDVPAWSGPLNSFLVAATGPAPGGTAAQLWTVDTGGHATPVAGSVGAMGPVAVGPTGRVAVAARPVAGSPAGMLLFDADAGSVRRVDAPVADDDHWPAFAPSGATLLIGRTPVTGPAISAGIWSLDLDGGTMRQLSTDGAWARWLP